MGQTIQEVLRHRVDKPARFENKIKSIEKQKDGSFYLIFNSGGTGKIEKEDTWLAEYCIFLMLGAYD